MLNFMHTMKYVVYSMHVSFKSENPFNFPFYNDAKIFFWKVLIVKPCVNLNDTECSVSIAKFQNADMLTVDYSLCFVVFVNSCLAECSRLLFLLTFQVTLSPLF